MTEIILSLKLKSNPNNVAEVEPYIHHVFKELSLDDSLFGNMLIALTEAVSNAIIHGNGSDENKEVNILTSHHPDKVCLRVEDEGKGFNPHNIPDPTAPENLLTPGGRGVFLMQHLADKVNFYENGRIVELEFYFPYYLNFN
jgi:serine/threonine-protein kinase RsbW